MPGDTWSDIQALKSKRSSLREKLARRKQERQQLLAAGTVAASFLAPPTAPDSEPASTDAPSVSTVTPVLKASQSTSSSTTPVLKQASSSRVDITPEHLIQVEKLLLLELSNITLELPIEVTILYQTVCKSLQGVPITKIEDLIQKFAAQMLLVTSSKGTNQVNESKLVVESVDHTKLTAVCDDLDIGNKDVKKRKRESNDEKGNEEDFTPHNKQSKRDDGEDVIESLLNMQSAKQRETTKVTEEILELLSAPTAKEQSLVEKFKSVGGAQVQEFCNHGTREECSKVFDGQACEKLHFKKIIHKHTDETLGDCSFLNTCFHMDTCKYVHYEIDYPEKNSHSSKQAPLMKKIDTAQSTILYPPQWIQSDLRYFDMSVLGKFAVVMADPPWDIHMELPYGTMSDDEMRKLNIPVLQDDGYIFLWVTGRAMELGRECLKIWGYERVDEMIWVKTNQLQRIIRTGRTGHWLNHGKEHCLVGVKGNPQNVNRGLDCDVITAEVRATSHKPDEIYGIIERLAPGSRKIELFGRPHNIQPNWITLGNQTDGVKLLDPDVVKAFRKRYPDGNCLKPPTNQ